MSIALINDVYRKNTYQSILDIFKKYTKLEFKKALEYTAQIENSCYQYACKSTNILSKNQNFYTLYNIICINIIKNLDPKSEVGSKYLLKSIITGKINPSQIAFLDSNKLNPKINKHINETVYRQRNEKIEEKITTLYTCRKCRGNITTAQDVQLRAADEGSNTRITCMTCNNVWII